MDDVFDRIAERNVNGQLSYAYPGRADVDRFAIHTSGLVSNVHQFTSKFKIETCCGSLLRITGQVELYRPEVRSGNTERLALVLASKLKCSSTLFFIRTVVTD